MPEMADQKTKKSRVVSWLVVFLILLIWAAGIAVITFQLRRIIREQILQVYADVLYAATAKESAESNPDMAEILGPENEKLLSVLEASEYKQGVFAVRVFDAQGKPVDSFGPIGSNAPLSSVELSNIRALKPAAEYQPRMDLAQFINPTGETDGKSAYPVLRVLTPLGDKAPVDGAAEFILDGDNVAVAFREVDRGLMRNSLIIFAVGAAGIVVALGWAFTRLQKANSLLFQRTESLIKANHELALAAKTSAVGAITAHLIHDLKSPLFGLQSFVSSRASASEGDEEDWSLAMNTTRRMQKMISDIVKILQEEKTISKYELSVAEWGALLKGRIQPQAEEAGLNLVTETKSEAVLTNKDANILLLVATNILQNAIQATPKGGTLSVSAYNQEENLLIELQDTGPGLPDSILATLFTPSRSTKSGGTGLGLAISKQLANHIGADLELKGTSSKGTIFLLRVPDRILVKTSELAIP